MQQANPIFEGRSCRPVIHMIEPDGSLRSCESMYDNEIVAFEIDLSSDSWKNHQNILDRQGLVFILRRRTMLGSISASIYEKLSSLKASDRSGRAWCLAVDARLLSWEALPFLLSLLLQSVYNDETEQYLDRFGFECDDSILEDEDEPEITVRSEQDGSGCALTISEFDCAFQVYDHSFELFSSFEDVPFILRLREPEDDDLRRSANYICYRDVSHGFEFTAVVMTLFDRVYVRRGSYILITDGPYNEPVSALMARMVSRGSLIKADSDELRIYGTSASMHGDNWLHDKLFADMTGKSSDEHCSVCLPEQSGTSGPADPVSQAGPVGQASTGVQFSTVGEPDNAPRPGLYRLLEDAFFDSQDAAVSFIFGNEVQPVDAISSSLGWPESYGVHFMPIDDTPGIMFDGEVVFHNFYNQQLVQIVSGSEIVGMKKRSSQSQRYIRQLLKQKRLVKHGNYFKLTEDILMHSTAQAFSFIAGSRKAGLKLLNEHTNRRRQVELAAEG